MTSKLTLTVESTVIEKAKFYAKHTGRSLSELVENYLDKITQAEETPDMSTNLKKIVGSVHLPDDFNEEKELRSYWDEKHS